MLDINKDGEVAKFQPATAGSHTLVNFDSKVNSGSDKGFILVQDDSANSLGTTSEDLRMTIGVYNDFRSGNHSDELWFQGGGRLCYNVGSWDSELNTIIGTTGVGLTGLLKYEWRVNNNVEMTLDALRLELEHSVKCGYDTNFASYFGHTAIGHCGHVDHSSFAHIDRNTTTDYALLQSSSGKTFVNCKSNESIAFRSGNNDRMCMSGNGNFGIGTDSPAQKLDVHGKTRLYEMAGSSPSTTEGTLILEHGNRFGTSSIVFPSAVNRGSDYGYISYSDDIGASGERARLRIGTSNDSDDHIILQPSGNVGINNENPFEKLDVTGNIKASGRIKADDAEVLSILAFDRPYVQYSFVGMLRTVYRRLVGQRFTGMIVFSPSSNDHGGAVFHVAENSNSGSGDVTATRRRANYYDGGKFIEARWNGGYLEFYGRNMTSYQYYRVTVFGIIVSVYCKKCMSVSTMMVLL